MNDYVSVLLLGGAFIAAVAVLLAADPKVSKRLTMAVGAVSLIGGLAVYCYGYLTVSASTLEAVLRMFFSVFRMYIGESDYSDISCAPLFSHSWAASLFWAFHVLAFYTTSSAAISVIGANALKNLRIRLTIRKSINIIYGVNQNTITFGKALSEDSKETVVYVTEDADAPFFEAIREFNGILRTDAKAVRADRLFFKSLGLRKGRRKVTVYAIAEDPLKNLAYAQAFLHSAQKRGLSYRQISLVIHTMTDDSVKQLQITPEQYGYSFVSAFRETDLASRLLIQKFPPCRSISFNDRCCANENFEALIIGFGQLGQVVLRKLIMNGQFAGSTFRADIFAPDAQEQDGYFCNTYPGIFDNYQLHFHNHDGRSRQLYDHMNQRIAHLRYIVVCTGEPQMDEKIAAELRAFVKQKEKNIPVYQCSHQSVKTIHADTLETEEYEIYHPDVLDSEKLDKMAMTINQHYQGENSKGAVEDWMACDYFSRMSNRAFADFLDAVLCATGKTEEDALGDNWSFSPVQLEHLGQMEHARWCAFHLCMGFIPMSKEEYEARTGIYLEQKRTTGKGSIRVGKNLDAKTHACLIPWDDLDELSAKENALTGGKVDYKQMDINNVMLLPKLFRIRNEKDK